MESTRVLLEWDDTVPQVDKSMLPYGDHRTRRVNCYCVVVRVKVGEKLWQEQIAST